MMVLPRYDHATAQNIRRQEQDFPLQKGYGAFVTASGVLGGVFEGVVTELAAKMAPDRSQPLETVMIPYVPH
jgi:hypothetical protein